MYLATVHTVVLVITYTIITIQPSLFSVESDEVFKSFAWANQWQYTSGSHVVVYLS